ncbi:hypothetical protein P7546_01465, partial [Staphylococcus aureus]|nr:hypothetical protein [Staphylococcus aureus]
MKQNVEFNQAVIKFNKRNKINKSSNDEYIKKFRNKFGKFLSQSFLKSSPDSCVKCYTMFLPFLLIKIDVFS